MACHRPARYWQGLNRPFCLCWLQCRTFSSRVAILCQGCLVKYGQPCDRYGNNTTIHAQFPLPHSAP